MERLLYEGIIFPSQEIPQAEFERVISEGQKGFTGCTVNKRVCGSSKLYNPRSALNCNALYMTKHHGKIHLFAQAWGRTKQLIK